MSFGNRPIINSVIYKTSNNSFENFLEFFNVEFNKYLIDICKSQNNYIIYASDFSIDLSKYAEHAPATEFINLLFSCNLFQLISIGQYVSLTLALL